MFNLKKIKQSFYILFFKCTLDCLSCGYGEKRLIKGKYYEFCTKRKIRGSEIK